MKGIVLAGGAGTRLFPATNVISKQLLPVFDKPMIYYPIAALMTAGIKDILMISSPQALPLYMQLFKDGSHLGLNISYKEQPHPGGLAQAFLLGEKFIGKSPVCLILGDNIFYGHDFDEKIQKAVKLKKGAHVFGYYVKDPERYGVAEFDKNFKVIGLEEKPSDPKSNYAVTGLYFYDHHVVEISKNLKPSPRGELEITDVNKVYLEKGQLKIDVLGRGTAWLDTGTHESLMEASNFIETIENRQGLKIACLEEIAYQKGFIKKEQYIQLARDLEKSTYGEYLLSRIQEKENGHG